MPVPNVKARIIEIHHLDAYYRHPADIRYYSPVVGDIIRPTKDNIALSSHGRQWLAGNFERLSDGQQYYFAAVKLEEVI